MRKFLAALFFATLPAAAFTVTVSATSPTQALLTYSAPTAAACTLEVSESASYTPVVNDVSGSLFTSANSDARTAGALSSGIARIFVVGTRSIETALDSNKYSRALQQGTLHYYRVTCAGPTTATGTFTTKTLPYGATYQDLIPTTSTGTYNYPYTPETRDTKIIDPQTGVLLSRVSITTDTTVDGYDYPFPSFGGFGAYCAETTDAYGNYRCGLPGFGTGALYIYAITPSTGASKFLGFAQGSYAALDSQAGGTFGMGTGELTSWGSGAATTLYKGMNVYGRNTIARWVTSVNDSAGSGIISATTTDMLGGSDLTTLARSYNSAIGNLYLTGTVTTTLAAGTYTVTWVSGSKFIEGAAGMVGRTLDIGGDLYTVVTVPSNTSLTATVSNPTQPAAHGSATAFRLPLFICSMVGVQANYGIISCLGYQQDSMSWVGTWNFGNGTPLGGGGSTAAWASLAQQYALPATRWTGNHSYEFLGETTAITSFATSSAIQGGVFGGGPYKMVLGTNLSAETPGTIDTSITFTSVSLVGTTSASCTDVWAAPAGWVNGQPLSTCYPHYLMNVAVGDVLSASGGEYIQITAINSATSWNIRRGTQQNGGNTPAHTSGEVLTMWGAGYGQAYNANQAFGWGYGFWDFVNSPSGTEHAGDYVLNWGSHPVTRSSTRAEYSFDLNAAATNKSEWGVAPVYTVPVSSTFAGISSFGGGNTYQKHPSMATGSGTSQFDVWYFVGANAFGAQQASTATLVGGTTHVYRYDPTGGISWAQGNIWSRNAPIFAKTNGRALVDVSAPSKVLSDADDFVWCRPNLNGECATGSLAADPYVYFSLSTLDTNYCTGGENPTTAHDICIGNWTAMAVSATQAKFVTPNDTTGVSSVRPLARVFQNFEGATSLGNNLKMTQPGDWGLLWRCVDPVRNAQCAYGSSVWALKIPPDPGSDGVNRSTFVPGVVSMSSVPSGTATARVKFWYAEQGGTLANPYCTSRREACVAVTATITEATAFKYLTTDTVTPLACTVSCSISIPVVPLHAAYYSVEFLNGGGSVIGTRNGVALENVPVELAAQPNDQATAGPVRTAGPVTKK